MAAAVLFRTQLGIIGFTVGAAVYITTTEEVDDIPELEILTDTEVHTLCDTVRNPGGLINNPAAGAGAPAQIRNPGIAVSTRAETNLKLAAYYVRHQRRISRTPLINQLTLVNLRALRALKEHEKNHKNPANPDTLDSTKAEAMIAFLDTFVAHLSLFLGEGGTPLPYVIREVGDFYDEGEDPPGNYPDAETEMIARAPHADAFWSPDNTKVWQQLHAYLHGTDMYTHIKAFSRAKDGRGAYLNLNNVVLGRSKVDNIMTDAENRLKNTYYTGERRRFNIEKFIKVHIEAHNDIQKCNEASNGTIPLMDEGSKVRKFLDGIRTTKLDAAKGTIWASATMRNDFSATCDLITTFAKQSAGGETDARQVASNTTLNHGGRGRGGRGFIRGRGGAGRGRGPYRGSTFGRGGRGSFGRGGRGGRGGSGRGRGRNAHEPLTDRWYEPWEFNELGDDGRAEVQRLRKERDARRTSAATSSEVNPQETIRALTTALNEANRQISAVSFTPDTAAPTEPLTNRNNPALQRTRQI